MSSHDNGTDTNSTHSLERALSLDAYLQRQKDLPIEQELSEVQLRELYDNEEIDRFLHLFFAYVTEVQAPDVLQEDGHMSSSTSNRYSEPSSDEDREWTPVSVSTSPPQAAPSNVNNLSICEEIATRFVSPVLPHARPSAPFSFGRLRTATQRLYLAVLPVYGPFLIHIFHLATWEDVGTSLIYCSVYWTLWWHNFLLPALILRILFGLVRRRVFPYPSLEELRRRREEVLLADEFGQQVSDRLSASSSDMTEVWRLLKFLDRTRKKIAKDVKEKRNEKGTAIVDPHSSTKENALPAVDNGKVNTDLKRIGLRCVEEIADLHERVTNIFIWRKPASSRLYAVFLLILLFISFFPAQYILKLVLFAGGFLFWHVLPVLATLSESDLKRMPPPFFDVPTDAEYAMDLISQRVAAGLEVNPSKASKHTQEMKSGSSNLAEKSVTKDNVSYKSESSFDWKKWGDRVATSKSLAGDIKRLKIGSLKSENWPPHPIMFPVALGIAQPQMRMETHTYPCQHSSSPGLITLTQKTLVFTQLMSNNAKLVIPLTEVKGLKKIGILKGINIRWTESQDGHKEQKEDKFIWVGGRDDLFARLVGADGKRWMRV